MSVESWRQQVRLPVTERGGHDADPRGTAAGGPHTPGAVVRAPEGGHARVRRAEVRAQGGRAGEGGARGDVLVGRVAAVLPIAADRAAQLQVGRLATGLLEACRRQRGEGRGILLIPEIGVGLHQLLAKHQGVLLPSLGGAVSAGGVRQLAVGGADEGLVEHGLLGQVRARRLAGPTEQGGLTR